MKGRGLLGLSVFGLILILFLMLTYAQSYRPIREKFVVGTWYFDSIRAADSLCLHVFPDHTYTQESLENHRAKSGTWRISGFPDRGILILKDWVLGTDTVNDGRFTLDMANKSLKNRVGFSSYVFTKESDHVQPKLSADEKFVIGAWQTTITKDKGSYERFFFMSDHQFSIQFESSGIWSAEGSKIVLDRVDEDNHKPYTATLSIDKKSGKLRDANGHSLVRMKAIL